jgi:uncharacterized membrane protein YoaK (UPF0700 family)
VPAVNIYVMLGIAVAVIGFAVGRLAVISIRRHADDPTQAADKQHRLLLVFLAVLAVSTTIDAITTPRHRMLDVVVLVMIPAGIAFDWIRARRTKTG